MGVAMSQDMYPSVSPDLPWLHKDESWASPPPEALGALFLLKCPACGFNYNHILKAEEIDGEDSYRAWMGRGDMIMVKFSGECGHEWSLRIGFHKGESFIYAAID
jgi:hypothetical protein